MQGTSGYAQTSRALLPRALRPGLIGMLSPDGPYPRELRQGTAQNTQLRRALPREERQRTLQCPQPKRRPGRWAGPDLLVVVSLRYSRQEETA